MANVPFVLIRKSDGNTGVATTADPRQIAAIIAPCEKGPSSAAMASKPATALTTWGYGMLTELFACMQPVTGKPAVLVRGVPSIAAAYGTVAYFGTGTLCSTTAVTPDASQKPLDDFLGLAGGAVVAFLNNGTTGTTGIQYQTSIDARDVLDPAKVWSPVQQLGTALVIQIPNTGIKFAMTTGKTVIGGAPGVGDYFVIPCTGPRLNASDVQNAINALLAANLPWECIVVTGHDISSTSLADLDTSLSGYEARGRFRMFAANTNPRAQDGSESEAQYLTRMTTLSNTLASIRGCVAADSSFLSSPQQKCDLVRPALWSFATWLMNNGTTIDVAQPALGQLPNGCRLYDENNNPVFHDEDANPGLNAQRFVTLRTWANKIGTFITNPLAISTPGSDYVFAQMIRTMNVMCEASWGALVEEMSKGIIPDLTTGLISEASAQAVEQPINNAIKDKLGSSVPYAAFTLSRDDALPTSGATLTGVNALIMPIYIKGFLVNAQFERTISVSANPGFGA